MTQQVTMIFVGRLTKEKGFHLVLELLQALKQSPLVSSVHCHIFWSGALQPELEAVLPSLPFVTFHGFQPKEAINYTRQQADITLMPSLFLETFGMSALESLQLGVPVVGFAKGGIMPFIFPEYQLDEQWSYTEQMLTLLTKMTNGELPDRRTDARTIANKYTEQVWMSAFKSLLGKQSGRILLVSDYICPLGGVEQYLQNVYHLLIDHGFEVQLVGSCERPSGWKKWFNFLGSYCNIPFALRLMHTQKQFQPDLIWRHGVQRLIGWVPLALVPRAPQERVMYHEVGLFHPFPAQVTSEQQLISASSLGGYLQQASSWLTPFVFVKALFGSLILSLLGRRCIQHLVPSDYLLEHGRRRLPQAQRTTFSHFVK